MRTSLFIFNTEKRLRDNAHSNKSVCYDNLQFPTAVVLNNYNQTKEWMATSVFCAVIAAAIITFCILGGVSILQSSQMPFFLALLSVGALGYSIYRYKTSRTLMQKYKLLQGE